MGAADPGSAMSDDDLFDQVGRALDGRPGWHYEPSPTPGLPASWCLDPAGRVVLSVTVVDGTVTVYVPDADRDVPVGGVAELAVWLDAYGDGYLAG